MNYLLDMEAKATSETGSGSKLNFSDINLFFLQLENIAASSIYFLNKLFSSEHYFYFFLYVLFMTRFEVLELLWEEDDRVPAVSRPGGLQHRQEKNTSTFFTITF